MSPRRPLLPVDAALPELLGVLEHDTSAVLVAPPGAGKTTYVPLALLEAPWRGGRRIVILEPRRLAARAAAHRMAALLGERVGDTVGFRIRHETRVGPRTRIEVVTEGVLTRMLLDDPALESVAMVIFDEFHERSLAADLGLALTLQSRQLLRDDLRVLAMSATLDGARVAALLGDAPVVRSEGRSFPVETRYVDPRGARVERAVASAIRRALAEHEGDVLAFLPGAGEIRRAEALLADAPLAPRVRLAPLFGNLDQEAQDRAIAPSPPGERKVVLATSIAETSLTIEGVRVVVDSGLARVPRFSPRTGMTRLETVRVSRASADQRRGRAGRVAPGICYRLWPEHESAGLLAHSTPEILEADLAPLALDLAVAGVRDPAELQWLDEPPAAAFAQARELLHELDALDHSGRATAHGRAMAELALHPRLAHMLLRARDLELGDIACDLAALLGERDVLRWDGPTADADVRLRLLVMNDARDRAEASRFGARVDTDAVRRVRMERDRLRAALGVRSSAGSDRDLGSTGVLLAFAYPDRVAVARPGASGRFLLRNGRGAVLAGSQSLSTSEFIVVAAVDDQRPESRIHLAAAIAINEIELYLADQIEREETIEWDARLEDVAVVARERLGAIVLTEGRPATVDPAVVALALAEGIRRRGLELLPWTDAARRLQQRVAFVRTLHPEWPDLSDAALTATIDDWLLPRLDGLRGRADLAKLDLAAILLDRIGWEHRRDLDALAPTHLDVPSGSRIPIDYADPESPVLAVRLQEMFGRADTPRIGGGRVPLTLHLLSPAHRPLQVTRDLGGFWRGSYADVRREMRGRYPRHEWPDDPLSARPTKRAKPRR
jgi:ATP-dependent helicase HrpB